MIRIKVSGFKDQTMEFEQPNTTLLFLQDLREQHQDHLLPLIRNLDKPSPFYPPTWLRPTEDPKDPAYKSQEYRKKLREITSKHPMKVEILEFDDDMSGLI